MIENKNIKYIRQKRCIGILGGTFDPAHKGHKRISNMALNILKLDEIWWLVSLSNPLKKKDNISEFSLRFNNAKRFAKNRRIIVSDLEKKLNTPYTSEILNYLKKEFPKTKFVWIMGIDNLDKFHYWLDWKKIFSKVPIAIFDRPFYSLNILKSKCLGIFKKYRVSSLKSKVFKKTMPPSWIFLTGWSKPISSTVIKENKLNDEND